MCFHSSQDWKLGNPENHLGGNCFAIKIDPIVTKQFFSKAAELKGENCSENLKTIRGNNFSKHLEVDDERKSFIMDIRVL